MKPLLISVLSLAMLAAAMDAGAWSHGRRGGFHHHSRVFVSTGFYFGAPFYFYHPPPYYYGPTYEATDALPAIYIEKFEGAPSADAGEIYCPQLNAYYPDVQQCPNGWQRIIRAEQRAAQGR
jgi:hypothetical protein